MNYSVAGICILFTTLLSFSACKVNKTPARKYVRVDKYAIKQRYGLNTVDTPGADKAAKEKDAIELKRQLMDNLLPLWQYEIPFTTFNGKAKMHYASSTDKQEFVAHIRISKDKVIWINVTAAMGAVNVARVLVTPDSIYFVNYLQREAQKIQLSDAAKLLPVPADFKVMQNLIIGNILNRTGNISDATDFGGTWTLQVEDTLMTQELGFNKSDSTIRSLQMKTKDNVLHGMIKFGSYELTNGRKFSTGRAVSISNAGEPHDIDMNFNKAEFDQPVDFPFSIPKNFKLK